MLPEIDEVEQAGGKSENRAAQEYVESLGVVNAEHRRRIDDVTRSQDASAIAITDTTKKLRRLRRNLVKLALQIDNLPAKV
jgi:hypothetical protein